MKSFLLVLAMFMVLFAFGDTESVTNVRGVQRENSKLVDIYYDLNATDYGTYTVGVKIEGRTIAVNASTFTGDVGEGVTPGTNRHILWDAGTDWPNKKGDVKAIVTATKEEPTVSHGKVQLWEGGPYWADRNIGADKPWDYGLYFWWGDTTGHRPSGGTFGFSFEESSCPTSGKGIDALQSEGWIVSKDGTYVLALSHDAAHVNWGGGWRMPTDQEIRDLNGKCDWMWATMTGVNGYVVRGRGNYASVSIFLPAASDGNGISLNGVGSYGSYWSSVPKSDGDFAYEWHFTSSGHNLSNYYRFRGQSVRPVLSNAEAATGNSAWFFVDTTDGELTLVAESANWSSGSIMLCCTNGDASGTAHTYSLFYEDESGNLVAVEGENAVNVSADANGNAHLIDTAFSSRLDGIKPVKYHVKDENGRVSEACETRTRHGISVGLSKFDPSYPNTELIQPQNEAELFRSVMIDKGGIDAANIKPLINSDAKYQSISDEWNAIAERTRPGDVVFFYVATHGVATKGQIEGAGAIAAYNGDYTAQRLQDDLRPFTSSDLSVKVVLIIMTCHSEAMVRPYEWGNMFTGKPNVLYITATSPTNNAFNISSSYSEFGEFFLNQGLELRQADAQETLNGLSGHIGNRDGTVDLLECAKYAQSLVSGLSDIAPSDVRYDGDKTDIMSHTPMVKGNVATPTTAPSAPGLECTVINEGVEVQVTQPANAKYCKMYYRKADASGSSHRRRLVGNAPVTNLTAVMADERYCSIYSPLENKTKYLFWAIAVGPGGTSPICGPYEMTTGADNLDRWITFNAKEGRFSDGKAEEKYTRLCGSTIGELPPDPLRAGYKFIGWYMFNDGEWGEEARENTVVSHSVIYYARWEAQIDCTVKLDVKGAPLSLPNIVVRAWEPVGELPEPQWQGHVFAGWFSESGGHGTRLWPYSVITRDVTYYAYWTTMTTAYLSSRQTIYVASNGDIAIAATMTAANGYRTVGECYALGIDPEDPNDDLRITAFKEEGGQPVITVNHTTDGSGNSFANRIRTLGKKTLMDAEWIDVTDITNRSEYRFFKVSVEVP